MDDLQSEVGTRPRIKDQDFPPTLDEISLNTEGVRLVDRVLDAPIPLTLKMLIQYMPSLGRYLMTWLREQEEQATPTVECDYVEEGIDLHNIAISWEGETSNVIMLMSHKSSLVITAIIDEGSGVNILSRETYDN